MAARKILSVARRSVSSGSEDFLCKHSSSSNLLMFGVRFLSDLPDTGKYILARMDHNREELRRTEANVRDLAAMSEELRGTTAKLREYHNGEVLKYQTLYECRNSCRGYMLAVGFCVLLIGVARREGVAAEK